MKPFLYCQNVGLFFYNLNKLNYLGKRFIVKKIFKSICASVIFTGVMATATAAQGLNSLVFIDQIPETASQPFSVIQYPSPNFSSALTLLDIPSPRRGNLATILQEGNQNTGFITQTGRGNIGLIQQIGFNNSAVINQVGTNNRALIAQRGRNNTARIIQR